MRKVLLIILTIAFTSFMIGMLANGMIRVSPVEADSNKLASDFNYTIATQAYNQKDYSAALMNYCNGFKRQRSDLFKQGIIASLNKLSEETLDNKTRAFSIATNLVMTQDLECLDQVDDIVVNARLASIKQYLNE